MWQLSGAVWMRRKLPAEAERAYRRVTELAADFLPGWVNLFRAREALGDIDGARGALDRAGAIAPQDPNLLHARADFLYRHGQRSIGDDCTNGGETVVLRVQPVPSRLEVR